MKKIVYVEDDSEVGTLIAAWLGKHDFEVIVEPRGDRALEVIEAHTPDLVLLDILLPGKDGMTLCRDLRSCYAGPIVLLTSLDSDMNHVLALEMGANDYILKTTPPAVLLARVRLHLRQNSGAARAPASPAAASTASVLHFGQLSIDAINRQVILDGHTVLLSRRTLNCSGSSPAMPGR